MLDGCKVFLFPCKKRGNDSKKYLQYQRNCVNKILDDIMQREFQVSYSQAVIEKDKYGKPFFKDFPYIHYNVSHCDGFIVCCISKNPIGVDVENVREYPDKVLHRVFSNSEKEVVDASISKDLIFFQFWTLKEAYIKAIGKGLSFRIDKLSFEIREAGEITCNQNEGYFKQFLIHDGKYVVSVCTLQEMEVEIEYWNGEDQGE